MLTRFIYNASSGSGKVKEQLDDIISALSSNGQTVEVIEISKDSGHIDLLADSENVDSFVIAGGDGTVSRFFNNYLENNKTQPIGILPGGTANDFAKEIYKSDDILEISRAISSGNCKSVDIAQINDTYFINVMTVGNFTSVSQNTNLTAKKYFGKLAYFIQGLKELFSIKQHQFTIRTENASYTEDAHILLVFNGKSAGNMNIAYKASTYDGLLDVIIIKNIFSFCFSMDLFRFVKDKHLEKASKNIKFFRVKQISLSANSELISDVDGEAGPSTPMEITCIHRAIKILGAK
ncbi:MAG: YegS/Rv2252/BmrU family lipid kinase [Desulfotalea sp.]